MQWGLGWPVDGKQRRQAVMRASQGSLEALNTTKARGWCRGRAEVSRRQGLSDFWTRRGAILLWVGRRDASSAVSCPGTCCACGVSERGVGWGGGSEVSYWVSPTRRPVPSMVGVAPSMVGEVRIACCSLRLGMVVHETCIHLVGDLDLSLCSHQGCR